MNDETLVLAESLCPAAVRSGPEGVLEAGCRACVGFDEDRPDGKIVHEPPIFQAIDAHYVGAFTGSGRREALVLFGRCTDGTGAIAIAERSERAWYWYPRRVALWTPQRQCVVVPRAQGNLLACNDGMSEGGEGAEEVSVTDFAVQPERLSAGATTILASFEFNSPRICEALVDTRVRHVELGSLTAVDVDNDGLTDLRVRMSHGSQKLTPNKTAHVAHLCVKQRVRKVAGPHIPASSYMTVKEAQLVFVQKDGHLIPTASTKALLREVGAGAD